jgi:membrane peptidoglycan carboxypeptidase
MSCAFATFANHGQFREGRTFYGVLDDNGNVVLDNDQETRQVFGEKAMNYLNICLTDAVAQGTGTSANLFNDIGITTAGKTGTTQSNKDRYFCGYTGYYTAAVWCGFDTPEQIYMNGETPEERQNPSCQLWKKVMLQLHNGLDNIPLYDSSEMERVTLCLESGLLATEACSHDIRGGRTFTQPLYPEDIPTTFCNLHIMVDYCVDGVAGEYCHKFQSVGMVGFSKKALVRITQARIDELMMAKGKGLLSAYTNNNYVYLVDENANPLPFYGMDPEKPINNGVEAPYQVCTKHTKEAWDQYVADHPWLDDTPDEPEEPVVPEEPTDPSVPADPSLPTDPALPVDPTQNTNTED